MHVDAVSIMSMKLFRNRFEDYEWNKSKTIKQTFLRRFARYWRMNKSHLTLDDFLPSVSQLVQKSLFVSVKLSLTDHQNQTEEEWTEREKERKKKESEGRRAVKFSHTWRIFPPSFSLCFSLSSLPPLCLSDVTLCFTGPTWVGDLRWKTSEFLDLFKGTRGPKNL